MDQLEGQQDDTPEHGGRRRRSFAVISSAVQRVTRTSSIALVVRFEMICLRVELIEFRSGRRRELAAYPTRCCRLEAALSVA